MAPPLVTQYVSINSSTVVSSPFRVGLDTPTALYLPNSVGDTTFLQGSWDASSANFARIQLRDGSGDWSVVSGTAAVTVTLEEIANPFDYLRVQVSSGVTDTRTFVLNSKVK